MLAMVQQAKITMGTEKHLIILVMTNEENNTQTIEQTEQKIVVRLTTATGSGANVKNITFGTDTPIKARDGEDTNLIGIAPFDAKAILLAYGDDDARGLPLKARNEDVADFVALKLAGAKVEVRQTLVKKGEISPLTIKDSKGGLIAEKGEQLEEDCIFTRVSKLLELPQLGKRSEKRLDDLFTRIDQHIEQDRQKEEEEED